MKYVLKLINLRFNYQLFLFDSTIRKSPKNKFKIKKNSPDKGLEPLALRLKVSRSTN